MSEVIINKEMIEAAVIGGCVLGGGGGGSMVQGRELAELAMRMGTIRLIDIDDIHDDATLVTVSAVGSPAAKQSFVKPIDYIRAVELLSKKAQIEPDGLISNECGGTATINGWLQAAILGIPVVDAPCNGRAHPTGAMGSIGLHVKEGYTSYQAAVGGDPSIGRYIELAVQGSIEQAANMVRQAAVQAGGWVAVARNPVEASYVKKHAALGAICQSITLGQAMLAARAKGGLAMIEVAAEVLGGNIVEAGVVEKIELITDGGYDYGLIMIGSLELAFWNEYMSMERNGARLGTFPDLIMTLDKLTGMPLTTAEIKERQEVAVLYVPKSNLLLGTGALSTELLAIVEPIVRKCSVKYALK